LKLCFLQRRPKEVVMRDIAETYKSLRAEELPIKSRLTLKNKLFQLQQEMGKEVSE
jgi:hypothetical protein